MNEQQQGNIKNKLSNTCTNMYDKVTKNWKRPVKRRFSHLNFI